MKKQPISITNPRELSGSQKIQLRSLAAACCAHDQIRLSFPTDGDADCYLLTLPGAQGPVLVSALAVVPLSGQTAECTGFTLPEHRKNGYFFRLLGQAMERWSEWDFLFPVSGQCGDTLAVLEHLGAELDSQEFQMELSLSETDRDPHGGADPHSGAGSHSGADSHSGTGSRAEIGSDGGNGPFPGLSLTRSPSARNQPDCEEYQLLLNGTKPLGLCQITRTPSGKACLHHVEIHSRYRKRGYGTAMIRLLGMRLAGEGVSHLFLHVSGGNRPALALYKKTGFRITETLSYYLY